MKKFYTYAFIAMILLPFRVSANYGYGLSMVVPEADKTATVLNIALLDVNEQIVSSQAEPDKPTVQLFPNPNQGEFTLKIADDIWQGATATLHNIIGLEIDRRTVLLGENNYRVSECQPGIYFLTLQRGDLQKVLRFVKS